MDGTWKIGIYDFFGIKYLGINVVEEGPLEKRDIINGG